LGEYSFFTGDCYKYSARSINLSKIIIIDRKKFLEIIKKNTADYEKFVKKKKKKKLLKNNIC
jgi:2-polyprenyl-3-methyl-5-hydroxy-6-metoxy-1,4-benzoquinol methylase